MASSADKVEAIFEIIRDLDGLDGKAWMKLIGDAEGKREMEILKRNLNAVEKSQVILNMVIPLVKLTRLILASEEVDPFMRTIIVRPLIQELLYLLTPIEASGILQSLIYSTFDESKPRMPMMIVGVPSFSQEEKEDGSRTIV